MDERCQVFISFTFTDLRDERQAVLRAILDEQAIAVTETKYDYALESRKPVLPLLHQDPDSLPREKTETDEAAWRRLEAFWSRSRSATPAITGRAPRA